MFYFGVLKTYTDLFSLIVIYTSYHNMKTTDGLNAQQWQSLG